jgi:hypothetical protein
MDPNSNAFTAGNKAKESKPRTVSEWKCPQCSYRNDEEIARAVFGDTDEGTQICIICYNLDLQSSYEVLSAK